MCLYVLMRVSPSLFFGAFHSMEIIVQFESITQDTHTHTQIKWIYQLQDIFCFVCPKSRSNFGIELNITLLYWSICLGSNHQFKSILSSNTSSTIYENIRTSHETIYENNNKNSTMLNLKLFINIRKSIINQLGTKIQTQKKNTEIDYGDTT